MKFRLSAVLLVAAYAVSCGGGGNRAFTPQPTPTPARHDLTGTWQISTYSSIAYLSMIATGDITQTGTSYSGTFLLSGDTCALSAPLNGTILDDSVTFQLVEGVDAVTFIGSVTQDGKSAVGTYTSAIGGCTNGDYGNWSATKVSAL